MNGSGLSRRENSVAAALILLTPALEKQQASRRVYPGGPDGGRKASPLGIVKFGHRR
jgi:hypothetical protein